MPLGDLIGTAKIGIEPDMSGFKKLSVGVAAAGAAAGAALMAGINEAFEHANITSTLQAQLGTTDKVAQSQGKLAGKLYASGVSDTFQEAADSIKATVQSGLAPPDATNKQLDSITTHASDVAKVFGKDIPEVTNSAAQLIKTGLAKNSTQAFDIITRGFQSGADKAGDFLDTINEYSTQWRSAGVSGQQALGLINQGLKAGARDSDIVADTIKEFSIRAVDGSKTTKQGFEELGFSAKKMTDAFGKGGSSANKVLDQTLDKLRKVKDPVKQAQIATKLFGTQSEDTKKALLALDPSTAVKGIGKLSGATSKLGSTLRSGPSYEIQTFKREVTEAFVDVLGSKIIPVVSAAGEKINEYLLPPLLRVTKAFNAQLAPAFFKFVQVAKVVLPPILKFGMTLGNMLVPALLGLGKAGLATINFFKSLGVWLIPIGIAVAGLTLAITANSIAVAFNTAVYETHFAILLLGEKLTKAWAAAQAIFNAVMEANPVILIATAIIALGVAIYIAYKRSETFRKIVQGLWAGLKVGWAAVVAGFKVGVGALVTAWHAVSSAFETAYGWVKSNWPLLLGIITGPIGLAVVEIIKHWDAIKNGAITAFNAVVGFFKTLPGKIGGAVAGLATTLYNKGRDLIMGLLNGAIAADLALGAWLRALPGKIGSWIGDLAVTLYTRGKNLIIGLLNGAIAINARISAWLIALPGRIGKWIGTLAVTLYTRGKNLIIGLLQGAMSLDVKLGGWLRGRAAQFARWLGTLVSTLFSRGKNLIVGLLNGAISLDQRFGAWMRGIPGKLVRWLGSLSKTLYSHGTSLISGLLGGATDKLKGLGKWASGIKDKIVGAIKSVFGIHSPSTVMAGLGGHMMSGLLNGLLSGHAVLSAVVKKLFKSPQDLLGLGIDKLEGLFGKGLKGLGGFFGGLFGGGGGGGNGGSGVARWKPYVSAILSLLGQPQSYMNTVLRRMNQESGGNPNAINLWDSNAKAGHPSQGLMQTIPGTFNAYAGPYRSRGILDPFANIYAGLNYALHTYGSLSALNRPGGYATGTGYAKKGWHWVGERGPELMRFDGGEQVKSNRDSMSMASYGQSAGRSASGSAAGGGNITVHVHVGNTLASAKDLEDAVYNALDHGKRKGRKIP